MSEQSAYSAFYKLPEELLVLILDHTHETGPSREGRPPSYDEWHDLKNLRLACPQYAYLPRLLSTVFHGIRLAGSPIEQGLHDDPDLSTLGPYVKRVIFEQWVWSEGTDARVVQSTFTALLRQLPSLDTVTFQTAVEDTFFSSILASLGAAGTVIKQLEISHDSDGDFDWATDGQLDVLDLSSLQSLDFNPDHASRRGGAARNQHPDDPIFHRCGEALTEMLDRCSESIQKITLGTDYQITWPHPADMPPTLPNLRHICIDKEAQLNLTAFASFLRTRCPTLETLKLYGPQRYSVSGTWQEVWNAVRDHPCLMQVDFTGMEDPNEGFDNTGNLYVLRRETAQSDTETTRSIA